MYILKDFISNALPYKNIKSNIYRNVNNKATLEVKSSNGIPYGTIAIFIILYIITAIVNQKSRRVAVGKKFNRFMKNCGYNPTGGVFGNIGRFKEQWQRILATGFTFIYDGKEITIRIIQPTAEYDGYLEIDEESYKYILKNTIYVDDEVIKKLKYGKYGCLTLNAYFWVSLRKYSLHKFTNLKYEDLHNQIGSGIKDIAVFKAKLKQAFMTLATILKDDGYCMNLGENALNLIDFTIKEAKAKIQNFQKFLKSFTINGKYKFSITFHKDSLFLSPQIFS
ncbi:MAG: hypothetical protein LBQ34_04940 [Alphaproteobacteria bacterium]|jgi:hypothetical protein|nr:hypothetical protein [Alphaproteobacteria bacterium]